MSWSLLRKEWQEHRFVGLGLLILLGGVLRLTWWRESEESGGFESLRVFARTASSIGVLFLANRLVAREYGGRTQVFLETLPLTRLRVLTTKWFLGALACVLICAAAVGLVWWWQSGAEVLSPRAVGWAFARCVLPMLALWAFGFAAAMLGRFRYLAWLVLAGGVFRAIDTGNATLAQVPILQLTVDAMSAPFPLQQALWPLVMIAFCIAAALVLGLWGEGSIASALSARMTTREWVTLISAAAILITVGELVKSAPELPPFTLQDVEQIDTRVGPVGVQVADDDERENANAVASSIAADVDSLAEALGLPKQSGFYVLPRVDLDGDVQQRARLSQTDGIVVQANVEAEDFELRALRSNFLHEMIADHTRDRALADAQHWFLDGLAAWWSVRTQPELSRLLTERAALSAAPMSASALRGWMQSTEQLGWCVAEGESYLAVQALADASSPEDVISLARELFQRPSAHSLHWLTSPSLETLVKRHTGLSLDQLAAKAEALRHKAGVAALPAGGTTLEMSNAGGRQRELTVHARGLPEMKRWRVSTLRIGPWEGFVGADRMSSVESVTSDIAVPDTFAVGDLVLVTVDAPFAAMSCRVRALGQRLEVR